MRLEQKKKRLVRLRRTLRLIWESNPWIANAGFLLVVIQAALPILLLFLIKLIVDTLAAGMGSQAAVPFREIAELVLLAAVVAIAESLAAAASRIVGVWQSEAVSERLHDLIHVKSIEVELGFYENARHRDTLHRAQQLAPFRPNRLVSSLRDTARNVIAVIALAGVLSSFHWLIVPIMVLSSLPGMILRLKEAPRFYDWWQRHTALERLARYLGDILTTAPYAQELRLYQLGGYFRRRFLDTRRAMREASRRVTLRRVSSDFVTEAISICGLFGVFLLLGLQTLNGAISLGGLVISFQALQRAWTHFGAVLRGLTELREDDLLLQDLYRFLDLRPQVTTPEFPTAMRASAVPGIQLRDVRFRYPGSDHDVLNGITLDIAPGEHVAVVGHNGSGKSTLIKLISRLYDPVQGSIMLDGIDLRQLAIADIRSTITVVTQDTVRYQETARDNIRFGARDLLASDAMIEAAARRSGAAAVIARLPAGYATMLGNSFEGARELSHGEWQKLSLARGFVRDASVILLDEPTSAMDPHAEEEVLRGFTEIARGRTTLVISHRLSTVMATDRIYVLDRGRIAESGTHAALMRMRGIYAGMFEIQAARYR